MTAETPSAADVGSIVEESEDGLERIQRESTAGMIARQLRGAIVEGGLLPGTQLKEMGLAERLGVSRAPIREALQRLIQEGLAESRRQGVFVREMTSGDIADIYFARTSCEMSAIDRILTNSQADWARLERSLESLEAAAHGDDRGLSSRADRRFHETLVEEAHSPRLSKMYNTLLAETALCLRSLERSHLGPDHIVAEHREILEALKTGDRDRARRALDSHMQDALDRLDGQGEEHVAE